MENILIHHVSSRNKKHKIATIIAVPISDKEVVVSWAKCNTRCGDHYDKTLGVNIALQRARAGTNKFVPGAIQSEFYQMVDRAKRYFKKHKILEVPERVDQMHLSNAV